MGDVPRELRSWNAESADLARRDPLFARALHGAAADVIDDVAHADVDLALECALGHRAFVHLNLHLDGSLYRRLRPSWCAALGGGSVRPPSRRAIG